MENRRRILLINAVQQRRFIMGAVLISIILINLAVLFSAVFNPLFFDAFEARHLFWLVGVEIVTVSGIAYFSFILSHRIAGPTYALARDLKKLADGDLTVEIRLRKGDFHMEAADALNFTAGILRTKMKAIKLELAQLETRQDISQEARRTIEQLLHDVAYFKTEPEMNPDQAPFTIEATAQDRPDMAVALNNHHAGG